MAVLHALAIAFVIGTGAGPEPQPIDPCDSAVIQGARAALDAVKQSSALHGGSSPCSCVYEGTVAIEAHLSKPGMLMTRPVRIELQWDGDDRFVMREVTGEGKGASTETTLTVGGTIAYQPSSSAPFKELPAAEVPAAMASIRQWLPATIAHAALNAAPSCRGGPEVLFEEQPLRTVSFAHGTETTCSLLLDTAGRLVRIETLASHQRLGDVCNWTRFDAWERRGPALVPTKLERFMILGSVTVRYQLVLKNMDFAPVADDQFALPVSHRSDLPQWNAVPSANPSDAELVQLAPTVWAVEVASADARALVIEGEHGLVVLEAPDGDSACTHLLTALKAQFPTKPVATVAFGHHHPSPSGGLRAMAAAGATIVAPRSLEKYVGSLLNRPTTLGKSAIAAPADPKIEYFEGQHTIEAGDTSVQLIDIGKASAHTDTYIVFYIPSDGILFEGDLSYFPTKGAIRVSPRLEGLVDSMKERNITPTRLVQTWPVRDALREVPWSTVTALVQGERQRKLNAGKATERP